MISGGCLCGAVRYEIDIDLPYDVVNCNCSMCRRSSGGTLTTWSPMPRNAVRWIGLNESEFSAYQSSSYGTRLSCPTCSCLIGFRAPGVVPNTFVFTVATFDDPNVFPARRDVWLGNRIAWAPQTGLPGEQDEDFTPFVELDKSFVPNTMA